jgi:hypothetical protein
VLITAGLGGGAEAVISAGYELADGEELARMIMDSFSEV